MKNKHTMQILCIIARAGHLWYFLTFSMLKIIFLCIFYQINLTGKLWKRELAFIFYIYYNIIILIISIIITIIIIIIIIII